MKEVSKVLTWKKGIHDNVVRHIWERLDYEKVKQPNVGDTVVDAGASIGIFTVKAALQVGNSGFVYAFEPEPENFSLLALNTKRFQNVKIFRKALWSSEGKKTLYLHSCNFGGHSLYPLPKQLTPTDKPKLSVQTTYLDKVVKGKVDFIKVDVERAELEVLKGAKRILECYHPFIAMELHAEKLFYEVTSFLESYGYKWNGGLFGVHTFEAK